ncbi:MAG: spore maturation protein [Anaerotruncus rubiinfantis]|jgi:spore maturation protein B|uniref:spore maturation protein n=1 Tax=Anaerotruncus TaxID=244127 RepID=UPI00243443D7|nr:MULTISPECIES: nucleoside recognition domain-containing protein [Anaerotruncus]
MNGMLMNLGTLMVPLTVAGIIGYAFVKGVPVFETFVEGAKEGLEVAVNILPALVGLITAVGMFKVSGGLDLLTWALEPFGRLLGLPREVLPLALLRPVSGSGALVIFNDLISTYGPDSLIGRVASVMQGSTETTFYTIALYYGAAGIKNTRHTVPAALSADLTGFIMSAFMVRLFFY